MSGKPQDASKIEKDVEYIRSENSTGKDAALMIYGAATGTGEAYFDRKDMQLAERARPEANLVLAANWMKAAFENGHDIKLPETTYNSIMATAEREGIKIDLQGPKKVQEAYEAKKASYEAKKLAEIDYAEKLAKSIRSSYQASSSEERSGTPSTVDSSRSPSPRTPSPHGISTKSIKGPAI